MCKLPVQMKQRTYIHSYWPNFCQIWMKEKGLHDEVCDNLLTNWKLGPSDQRAGSKDVQAPSRPSHSEAAMQRHRAADQHTETMGKTGNFATLPKVEGTQIVTRHGKQASSILQLTTPLTCLWNSLALQKTLFILTPNPVTMNSIFNALKVVEVFFIHPIWWVTFTLIS